MFKERETEKREFIKWIEILLSSLQQYNKLFEKVAVAAWSQLPGSKQETRKPTSLASYISEQFTTPHIDMETAITAFKYSLEIYPRLVEQNSSSKEATDTDKVYFIQPSPNSSEEFWFTKGLLKILSEADKALPTDKGAQTNNPLVAKSLGDLKPIPKKLHFFWVGRDISLKYLLHIAKFYLHAWQSGYEIHFWTDREISFYRTLHMGLKGIEFFPKQPKPKIQAYEKRLLSAKKYEQKKLVKKIKTKSLNLSLLSEAIGFTKAIKLRNVEELQEKIKDYSKTKSQQQKLELYMSRSKIGLKNLAEFSDFAKPLILYSEGGIFIDVDDESVVTKKIGSQEPIEKQLENNHYEFQLPSLKYGFGCGQIHSTLRGPTLINANDCIVSAVGHPILEMIIDEMLIAHEELDRKLLDRKKIVFKDGTSLVHYRTFDDLKRSFETGRMIGFYNDLVPPLSNKTEPYRIGLTLHTSGPSLFGRIMEKFAKQNNLKVEDLYIDRKFFSKKVRSNSDNNWGSAPNDTSFEEEIASKSSTFAP